MAFQETVKRRAPRLMRTQPLTLLAAAATLAVSGGPQWRAPGAGTPRVVAGLAAGSGPAGPAASALPRFALFGWVAPPATMASAARYAELAALGFNTTVLAARDSGYQAENLARLDWSLPVGVRNLIIDRILDSLHVDKPESYAWIDSMAIRYRGHPALLGYYLGDEPAADAFPILTLMFDRLRAADPAHPAWNNLFGRSAFATRDEWLAYVEDYIAATQPSVLCDDQYDFLTTGDRHQLVENVASLAAVARAHGLPFWGIVLLIQHKPYRQVTTGLLRWQIAQWLSYGARGIGYFTYWTPDPDSTLEWQPAIITPDGHRTAMYDTVRTLDARLLPLGETLAGLTWLATVHAGSVPPGGTPFAPDSLLAAVVGRATIGVFADPAASPCLFVANADSLSPRAITLTLAGGRRAWRWQDDGTWSVEPVAAGGRVTLALEPGDYALLRLSGAADGVSTGAAGPALATAPNPARGLVRFSMRRTGADGTLELLDLNGRRAWSRRVGPQETGLAWDGRRDDGRPAPPGVYFARLEDTRGVAIRRVVWLGP